MIPAPLARRPLGRGSGLVLSSDNEKSRTGYWHFAVKGCYVVRHVTESTVGGGPRWHSSVLVVENSHQRTMTTPLSGGSSLISSPGLGNWRECILVTAFEGISHALMCVRCVCHVGSDSAASVVSQVRIFSTEAPTARKTNERTESTNLIRF